MTVTLEVRDGVGTIQLDRPPMNALDVAIQDRLRELAEEATRREDVRAVILYGGEKVFAAGADIKEMQAMDHTAMVLRSRGSRTPSRPSPASRSRSSPPSPATPSAAAANWRSAPTSGSPPTTPSSASRRSSSA